MTREDELIKKLHNGEAEALDELIGLYYPAIFRYCLWHMPDRESARDAVQETFLKMVRALERYEQRGQFKAFLYRIAANTCIDLLRKEWRTEEVPEDLCFEEPGFRAAEDREQLAAAFQKLDQGQRELVLLKFGQELTLREIAAVTGLPLRTVQSRLRKATGQMKRELEGRNR